MNNLRKFEYLLNEGISQEDLANTLCHRIEMRYPDIYKKYDYDKMYDAVDDVASFHAGAEELGTSDINIMIRQVFKRLEESESVAEGSGSKEKQKTPYRDINSPEYRAAAEKQKQQMAKDKAAEPGKKLADKIAKKGVAEGYSELDNLRDKFEKRVAAIVARAKKEGRQLTDREKKAIAILKGENQSVAEGSGPQVGDEVYYGNRLVGWFKGYSKYGKIITEPNVDEMGDEYLSKDAYWDPQEKLTIKPKQGVAEDQLDELKCWDGYKRVPGTRAGAPGSCEKINELSTEKLAQYKTAAGIDARAADKAGDFKRGDKRFAGIVKATKKQFDNETKPKKESAIMKGLVDENLGTPYPGTYEQEYGPFKRKGQERTMKIAFEGKKNVSRRT